MVRSSTITESSIWTPKNKHVNLSYSSLQIFGIIIQKEHKLENYNRVHTHMHAQRQHAHTQIEKIERERERELSSTLSFCL